MDIYDASSPYAFAYSIVDTWHSPLDGRESNECLQLATMYAANEKTASIL
jgi:hypothetical protein